MRSSFANKPLTQNSFTYSSFRTIIHTNHTRSMASFPQDNLVSRYRIGKTSLDLNEARDDWVWGCSGIMSWTICKQSAPRCRQITTPTPHQSIFTDRILFMTPNQQRQSTEGNDFFYFSNSSAKLRVCLHMSISTLRVPYTRL